MSAPRHLALIPDGNRRWARARGLSTRAGHAAGIAALGPIAAEAWRQGVEVLTFWWGSPANLSRRAPEEVDAIISVLADALAGPLAALLAAEGAGFEAHGRWPALCPALAAPIAALPPPRPGAPRLVLLMAYDGRDELRAAAEALGGGGATAADFTAALWTGHLPPVDLVLRTGGEPHLSAGFLLWGIAEAQLHFSAKLWPDFGPADLHEALAAAAATERRLGR
jgi:undecaprenyl diphosphate synthase